jgi:CheY-like chemotaxis protein
MSKIMIVDDEEKIRYIVKKMLEDKGHEVMEAESGKECLEIIKDKKPDLILMDVMMPEMDGWEAAREIKKDKANEEIIISMLTIRSEDEDKIKSLDDASADWHIAKPIKREKLIQTVGWLLKRPLKP